MAFRQLDEVIARVVAKLERQVFPTRMNQRQAARYLGVSEDTLARLRVQGLGPPCFKIGRRWSYAKKDLDAWKGTE